jgi:hypothetical protein
MIREGIKMQHVLEVASERFVNCLKGIVLECRCGAKLHLLGREADWRKEGRTVFECSGCEKRLSLTDSSRRVLKRSKV